MQQIENTIDKRAQYIEEAWLNKNNNLSAYTDIILSILKDLDTGKIRVAEKINQEWQVNTWIKKAILLSFSIKKTKIMKAAPENSAWFDSTDSKFLNWQDKNFIEQQIRAIPGCFVRNSTYIAKNVVLMPCFINVGAYIDENSLIDTWATIGSCAQIGKNCHISGGTGIGGVLEPMQTNPVIIEDNCFIGARSEIAEGVIVEENSVISMGVYIGSSTKIIHRETNEVFMGRVPKNSVVVPGNIGGGNGKPSLYCAVIVKNTDEKTRSKTAINELLRNLT